MLRVSERTIREIVSLFSSDHSKQGLSKEELFRKYFGEKYSEETAEKMYSSREKWEYLRRLMKAVRKKSAYFITGELSITGEWRYSLVRDQAQAERFKGRMASIRKGILYIEKRCDDYLERIDTGEIVLATVRKKKKKTAVY